MRALTRAVLGVVLCAGVVAAQEKPDTPKQAADKVLAAFEAKDQEALKALAEKDNPDPWIVAYELCFRGEHAAAEAFAKAAPRKAVEGLIAYMTSRRGQSFDDSAREAVRTARAAYQARRWEETVNATEAANPSVETVPAILLTYYRGRALAKLGRREEAIRWLLQAAHTSGEIGWTFRRCVALESVAYQYAYSRRSSDAVKFFKCALGLYEQLGDRPWVAKTLLNIGCAHQQSGRYGEALKSYQRGLKEAQAIGDRATMAHVLNNIGNIHEDRGNYATALETYAHALKLREELGDRKGVAWILGSIGNIHTRCGEYSQALRYQERALGVMQEVGDRTGLARTLGNTGIVHEWMGNYPKALDCQERSLRLSEELEDAAGVSRARLNIGNIHMRLGDYAKAVACQERSLRLKARRNDRAGVALVLGNIGILHRNAGDYAAALECQTRAMEILEELGDRVGVARALGNIGLVHRSLGDNTRALEFYEQSLGRREELGDRMGVAIMLGNIGLVHADLGEYSEALQYSERARSAAAEMGLLASEVTELWRLAFLRLALGMPDEAVKAARSGIEKLPLLVRGLGDEQSATARGKWAGLIDTGARAGMLLDDPAEVSFFLESGRAGVLLELLGGRRALSCVAIPQELHREEMQMRVAVSRAQVRHGRELRTGNRKTILEAREAVERTRSGLLEVVARIQRAAKAAADVVYPRAASLETTRASLSENDVLVLYALLRERAVALVVTGEEARVATLARTDRIRASCGELRLGRSDSNPSISLDALRRQLIRPLRLRGAKRRLIISPHGILAEVPFALLAPECEVVMVPSGTTYGVLLEERAKRGQQVLALGDPDQGKEPDPGAATVMRPGTAPTALPATREEAKAVGDVVLLGQRATETTLASALGEVERWRAVHLACHGLIRTDQPQLSSLALTPDEHNDGFLTVLEVFRMRIPADLVVLSACETARGKIYKAEGVIGFTRAFMFAGAPRVIVSLWKVDDEATRALMVKFYELWNPKDGSKGLPTATALKRAQEHVASHEKWKHPYYWAAWQLWGLGD